MAASAAAVAALFGKAAVSCASVRERPRFVCRRLPLEPVSTRTRNAFGSFGFHANGPLLTGVPEPPMPLAAHRLELGCWLTGRFPSFAQSQYGRPKVGALSTRCRFSSSCRRKKRCHGRNTGPL